MPATNPKVVAAGFAAASWVRARRANWDDPRLDLFDDATAEAVVAPTLRPIQSAPPPAPIPTPARELEPIVVDFAPPLVESAPERDRRTRDWAQSIGSSFVRWLPLGGVVLAVVAVGASGRAYWNTPAKPKTGVAVLESVPSGLQVLVDGKDAGATPLTSTLPVGPHTVEFRYKKATRLVQFAVTAGSRTVERVDWTKKPSGRLLVSSEPKGARVLLDGAMRGTTPLTLDDVVAGQHAIVLESSEGSIQRTVKVAADETTEVAERIFSGWLAVLSPFPVTISEGAEPIRLDERSQVMLRPGPHELRFTNTALAYQETRRIDVKPGEVTSLSLVAPHSTLSVTATIPAEVWIDGVRINDTPVVGVPVDLGTREIVVKGSNGEERRFTLTVTAKPVGLNVDFSKPAF